MSPGGTRVCGAGSGEASATSARPHPIVGGLCACAPCRALLWVAEVIA